MSLKQLMDFANTSRLAEQARIPSIKIDLLMGHSLGVTDSYTRFSEEQMLEDYLQGIEYLTVNQNIVLINKSIKQQSEYMQQSLKEMEEKHKEEIEKLLKKIYCRLLMTKMNKKGFP